MSVLERFVASKDRGLLPELADYLSECSHTPIDPATAVTAACVLSTMVNKRRAHSAWICIYHLSSYDANDHAGRFMDGLQALPECQLILDRCASCVTWSSPPEQRTTCLKFLAAFMNNYTYAQRLVSETKDMVEDLLLLVQQQLDKKVPVIECSHAFIALAYASMAYTRVDNEDESIGIVYATKFLKAGGLRTLTDAFIKTGKHAAELAQQPPSRSNGGCYNACTSALFLLWEFLNSPRGKAVPKESPALYTYSREEALQFAKALQDLVARHMSKSAARTTHEVTWRFLNFIRLQSGDELLTTCVYGGLVHEVGQKLFESLLLSLERSSDHSTAGDFLRAAAEWRSSGEYPLFSALFNAKLALVDAMLQRGGMKFDRDGIPFPNAAGPAAVVTPADATLSVREKRNRHCAYPGCTITGTGTERTAKCARCRAVYYCSKEHQTQHWLAAHRAECRIDAVQGVPTTQETGVKPQNNRHCAYPGCPVTGAGTEYTQKCARCRAVYYCSKEHQTQHWLAAHRAVCRIDGAQGVPTTKETGVKPQNNRHCAHPDCSITGTGTEYTWKCARCRAVYYCSEDHQAEHWWAVHKAVCRRVYTTV